MLFVTTVQKKHIPKEQVQYKMNGTIAHQFRVYPLRERDIIELA
jgi:hypothetical protein